MAGGAVRELITKVKIVVDKASQSAANKALQDTKKKADQLANKKATVNIFANAGGASGVLARIKAQLNAINGKTSTAYVEIKQKGKAAVDSTKKAGKALAGHHKTA